MKTSKRKAEYYISAKVTGYNVGSRETHDYTVAVSEPQALNNFKFKVKHKLGLAKDAHIELSGVKIKLTHYL